MRLAQLDWTAAIRSRAGPWSGVELGPYRCEEATSGKDAAFDV